MRDSQSKKYLTASEYDEKWGITVNTIGTADIVSGYELYPPKGHPDDFNFDINTGRILSSFQLIYIAKGRGKIFFDTIHSKTLEQGDMVLIRPGVWHSYFPDKHTGWKEYWIGAEGKILEERLKNDFFGEPEKIFKVGVREDIIALYMKALDIADKERPFYQQVLASILNMLLGMAIYYDKNSQVDGDEVLNRIQQSKALIREKLLTNITPEEIAEEVNISYSWFRKTFKEYTNMSPSHYMQDLKLQKAKEMLVNTQMSIKEISYSLNYDNISYFTTLFKRYIHMTPNEYREIYGVKKNIIQEHE